MTTHEFDFINTIEAKPVPPPVQEYKMGELYFVTRKHRDGFWIMVRDSFTSQLGAQQFIERSIKAYPVAYKHAKIIKVIDV